MRFIQDPLYRLRVVSLLEGISLLLLLFVAMPLKYLAHLPQAVRVVGMGHGLLFIAYVLLLVQNVIEQHWSAARLGLGLLASVLPFGAIYAEVPAGGIGAAERWKTRKEDRPASTSSAGRSSFLV